MAFRARAEAAPKFRLIKSKKAEHPFRVPVARTITTRCLGLDFALGLASKGVFQTQLLDDCENPWLPQVHRPKPSVPDPNQTLNESVELCSVVLRPIATPNALTLNPKPEARRALTISVRFQSHVELPSRAREFRWG